MVRGIYASCAGMGVQQARMDVLSNNLVNATTTSYKRDYVIQHPFPELLLVQLQRRGGFGGSRWVYLGQANQGAAVSQVVTDFLPGPLRETGRSTHLALRGENCFFVLSAPTPDDPDRVLYTRDGSFLINREGYLVNFKGNYLLGEKGPIFTNGSKFEVDNQGVIRVENQEVVDRLRLVHFANPAVLIKAEDNCYVAPLDQAEPAVNPGVVQRYLEESNVSLADEMINMINVVRTYQANQRCLQASDQLVGLAVNQVGSLR